ncbi:hypothetical protein [Sinorhizobium fredii]|jgi:hypothetical protein|uniref:N-acetyltransferase domain-containing protein n=1 Tax=Sinorhizobium fredii (strain USDA 257) TaxID=1185652 RepID=I3XEU2_SINF2|nr:hypothetical protein [Sinorhizobium fredii]AFL54398.1 hypothetical protein USDA257_c58870 [Sinorhizobium fredii USDA 257]
MPSSLPSKAVRFGKRASKKAPASAAPIAVRFLHRADVDALLVLERAKWTGAQAASRADLERRIAAFPGLSIGAFSTETGAALASLFLKPVTPEQIRAARTWSECAAISSPPPANARALFGISLSSTDALAVRLIFEFFWPYALKQGWRRIYLGSPMPGLAAWRRANPEAPIDEYVWETHNKLPRDPQLRYYYKKGFRRIEGWKADYFPHEPSLDHAALLRADIPLSSVSPLWTLMPLSWLERMRSLLFLVA